jgi:hypothetical protein
MAQDRKTLAGSSRAVAAHPAEVREAAEPLNERPDLTVARILARADDHQAAHRQWPDGRKQSAFLRVEGVPGESWQAINHALALGPRGLPGDSSLAELLAEHRGAPVPDRAPEALAEKIRAWEQKHFPIQRRRSRAAKPAPPPLPALTISGIRAWAIAHHQATGKWPNFGSGQVREAPWQRKANRSHDSVAAGGRRPPLPVHCPYRGSIIATIIRG